MFSHTLRKRQFPLRLAFLPLILTLFGLFISQFLHATLKFLELRIRSDALLVASLFLFKLDLFSAAFGLADKSLLFLIQSLPLE